MIRVFIGYDRAEAAAFSVLAHSIHTHASQPVAITPLMLSQLQDVFTRERDPLQSTDFSFSRFLVPYLCDYQGWAIFMDCDMVVKDDINQLWSLGDNRFAVQVVKHDHKPENQRKFLNHVQTRYQKKNWSSVMLFNCERCTALTPDFVNQASGLELHQFKWLSSDHLIGELPPRWNHLVGYDQPAYDIALLHYTEGGPYFDEYRHCEYANDWLQARDHMLFVAQGVRAANKMKAHKEGKPSLSNTSKAVCSQKN
ncbi:glycosyltransferase [Spartinivicinus ruber]|uniref:glycosyltransferase n=1 Tax=Spartinivicinus ruber TaxID=2683272 RepID=UPI0013D3B888|nr:glycosyltransferase [Spartinivicinus ruber]